MTIIFEQVSEQLSPAASLFCHMFATISGQPQSVACLQEFHDDPILRTRTQIACLLITNGAFVDVEDNMGRPPTRYGLQEVRAAVQHFMDAK